MTEFSDIGQNEDDELIRALFMEKVVARSKDPAKRRLAALAKPETPEPAVSTLIAMKVKKAIVLSSTADMFEQPRHRFNL